MARLRARFVARAPAQRQHLVDALADGNGPALIDLAHRLAGSGGLFGYAEVTDVARAIEQAARADVPPEELSALVDRLASILERIA